MRSVGAGIVLLLLAVSVAGGAVVYVRQDWRDPSALACEPDPAWPHLRLDPVEGSASEFRLVVVNPMEWEYRYWGAHYHVEHWVESWSGKVSPREVAAVDALMAEGYEGTPVPPGGEHVHGTHAGPADEGRHVLVWRMEGLCGVARYRVA